MNLCLRAMASRVRAFCAAAVVALGGCGEAGSAPGPPASPPAQPPPAGPPSLDAAAAADAAPASDCPAPAVWCDTLRELPPTIREAGFFPAAPDLTTGRASMIAFEPAWPLWSNGLAKARQVIVPPGKKIDIRNREVWEFPVGTLFLKTFFSEAAAGARRPVETRILRRVEDEDPFKQWQFAVYRWNEAGTDAALLPLDERVPVMASAGGESFTHEIPSREDCGKCHTANDTAVIGFDELRLNWTAPGRDRTELQRVAELGLLSDPPPAAPATVAEPDPTLKQIEGYVLGNCVHCHDGRNSNVVDMHPEVFVKNVVCQQTTSNGTLEGLRVAPGQPGQSILYLQLARMMRPGINPMPPVGVQRPDPPAVSLVSRWITGLRTPCPRPTR